MLKTIHGPQFACTPHSRPLLPPAHILHRTTTNPPHFNATKQTSKKNHTDPEHPPEPRKLRESEPHRQPETDTTPPSAAKRSKTSTLPQSPVSPNLCAVTRTSEETPGKGRNKHTGDTDANDDKYSDKGGVNKKKDITGSHSGGDHKNGKYQVPPSTIREQEPEEAPPGAKRPTSTDWDGKSKTQRRKWRRRHK